MTIDPVTVTAPPATFEPFHWSGMHEAYPDLIDLVLTHGDPVAPRGEPTRELLGFSFVIEDAVNWGVPVGCGRKVGVKMMAIDGAGNLAGRSYPATAIKVAPILERFSDRLDALDPPMVLLRAGADFGEPFFQGAYGPRMADQLIKAEETLRRDPDSRQAIVKLWDPLTDTDPRYKDRPCTTEVQFMIRRDGLHCFVNMRANDIWTGTCYDVWQFGQVQAALAHVLGVPVGPYHHRATSLHAYERDIEKLRQVEPWVPLGTEGLAPAVNNPRESWGPCWALLAPGSYISMHDVQLHFQALWEDVSSRNTFEPCNEVEAWYYSVLTTGQAPA